MTARLALLETFVENDCIPAEPVFAGEMDEIEARTGSRWTEIPPVLTGLKSKARSLGLWNLFMPKVCHMQTWYMASFAYVVVQGMLFIHMVPVTPVHGAWYMLPLACNRMVFEGRYLV